MHCPPIACLEKSKSAEGTPQIILLILPIVPQPGHGAVLKVIGFFSLMETKLLAPTDMSGL
jgi:hypothetical protein